MENRVKLIMLVGLPGSGKSTYAKHICEYYHPEIVICSSDSIRKELYGDESIQGDSSQVFNILHERVISYLNNGVSVFYDATNLTRKDRESIISKCPKFVQIEAHIIWNTIETCIEQDKNRDRTVGKQVIDHMVRKFQAPYYDEGIDNIKVVIEDNFSDYLYEKNCIDNMKISHDNHHHKLNIFEHCNSAKDMILSDDTCRDAASYHDIGKPYVKEFKDSKGNKTEEAHYYSHQNVGAWMSYGIMTANSIDTAWLISTHMDPFMGSKYYNRLPKFLKDRIDVLHNADVDAH